MARQVTTTAPKATTPPPAANTQAAVAANTGGPVRVPTVPNIPGTVNVLKVNCTFKGARKAWYESLVAHNGKPVNEMLAAWEAKRPSLPASGRPEPVSGWWRYFQRQGIVAAVVPKA